MLIPVVLPPGVYKNGTPYNRRGRWEDGNLVRWHDDSLRAIGGWLRRQNTSNVDIATLIADPTLEAIRDAFAWRSLSQDQNAVFGSNLGLYHMDQIGTITDITPIGVTTSDKDASLQAGYGQNPYGTGAYGVANDLIAQDPIPPYRWGFDNFGEILLTTQRGVGPLYELDIPTLTLSTVVNAPADCQDVVVTGDRIVMVVAPGLEPRKVQWSDQENRTVWTPLESNQAGDFTIPGNGRLLRAVNVLDKTLILGDNDAHVAEYIGPPYVFSITLVANKCGMICAESVAATERFAVWWGVRDFWFYDGTVRRLPCEVLEFLYDDMDMLQTSKITAFTNQEFSEVWWLYQSSSTTTTEVDSYVCWDYEQNIWTTGRIDRTAGIDKGSLSLLTMVSSAGFIFNHELDNVLPTGTVFAQTGEIDLQGGERNVAIRALYPDTEVFGSVQIEVIAKQFPTATEYTYGPYTYQNPTDMRAMGRSVKLKFTGLTAGFELGTMRIDVAPPQAVGRR